MKSSEDSGADESSQSASVSADQPDKLHYFNVQLTYFMLFCDLTSVQFDVTVNFFVTSWEKHKTLPTWDQLWQKPLLQALLRADGLLNQTPFKKQVFYGRDTCFLSETCSGHITELLFSRHTSVQTQSCYQTTYLSFILWGSEENQKLCCSLLIEVKNASQQLSDKLL